MRLTSKTPFLIDDLPELLGVLATRLESSPDLRMTIAQITLDDAVLAPGVVATRRKLRSKRTATKGPRPFSNVTAATASWPEDALIESKGIPKLVLVVHGHADLTVGQYTIHCGEGDFVVCPSGLPHPDGSRPHLDEKHQLAGRACCLLWFRAWESGVRCWSCYSRGTEHVYEDKRHLFILNQQANRVFELLCEEAENRNDGYESVCKNLLAIFITMMERELRANNFYLSYSGHLTGSLSSRSPAKHDSIGQAQEYIRSHLGQPLSIEDVARKVLMSRAQFTKRFRQETGKTFMEFVLECRLEHAKALLRESDWAASSVGAHSGFKSYSYFGKFFRSRVGMTPGEFRRRARSDSSGERRGDGNISR